jgi:two-component system CheB/CheR fusion protein
MMASTQATEGGGFMVVAVGASAGGLEACTKLLGALPAPTGMAFILVQHLDPGHKSLLVELLAEHTAMTVLQAA